ncbi:HAMP domain-containing histidine kinase [Streptomyces sp. NBC_01381]|uniref:sensor histidine kinase n=1 Tax=Streptomyces sp. NBC_01381 TaxID=2903845 RepID=UPI00224F2B5F|nr:HAMP domain-containing sensor histidine kinase [Streptomyces sp. NBC_01381]MCX4668072.1 HAMP domain-containing histidine kinase [Streptomyces sp. NBC_01381]
MRYRLLRSYLMLAALALIVLELPLGRFYLRSEETRALAALERNAEVLAAYADQLIEARAPDRLPALARDTAGRIAGEVVVVDARGQLLAASPGFSERERRKLARQPEIVTSLGGGFTAGVRHGSAGGEAVVHLAVPTRPGPVSRGAVRITVPRSQIMVDSHAVWLYLGAAGAGVLAVAAVVAFAMARWISRPVLALQEAAARVAAGGDLVVPARRTTGPPEIRRLTETLRMTARRLGHLLAAQRAFAGEASHQLKTPLAALRLRLENLEQDLAPRARRDLEAALAETDRLARTAETLLALSRLEESGSAPEPIVVDAVVAERVASWAPVAAASGVWLVAAGEAAGRVWALPGAVEQILDNLLSNAVRVCPTGGTVTVRTHVVRPRHRLSRRARRSRGTQEDGAPPQLVELHVVDEGPGLSPEERERAFDRFWRASDAPKGGSGLGLPLVRRLARAAGGDARLDQAPGSGVDAAVTLVRATSAVTWRRREDRAATAHPDGRRARPWAARP